MRNIIIILVAICIPASLLFAAEDNPIVTVLDLNVSQVSEQEATIFVDYFSSYLVESDKYRVIDRTQRKNILNELQFSYDGCADEQCQLEIGKLLAARYIFIGSLGKLGSRYILNMSLVEVETGETKKSVSDKYSSLDTLVDDTGRIVNVFVEQAQPALPAQPAADADEAETTEPSPEEAAGPAAVEAKPSVKTTAAAPKKKLKLYFDGGVQVGGPIESDTIDGPCFGAYIGGLFPLLETLYIGANLNFLFHPEDIDIGAVFLGANLIFGDPGELALGIGAEVSNAQNEFGGLILAGSLTTYVGGIDIRIGYGQDLVNESPVGIVGFGGHF